MQVLNAKNEQLAFAFQVGYTRSAWSPLHPTLLAISADWHEVWPAACQNALLHTQQSGLALILGAMVHCMLCEGAAYRSALVSL